MPTTETTTQGRPFSKAWVRRIFIASLVIDAAALLLVIKFVVSSTPAPAAATHGTKEITPAPTSLGALTGGEWTVHITPSVEGETLYDVYNAQSQIVAKSVTADEVRSLFGVEVRGLDASGPERDGKPMLVGPDDIR